MNNLNIIYLCAITKKDKDKNVNNFTNKCLVDVIITLLEKN